MALTTLAAVKSWMGITNTSKDTLLESLIVSCSQEIANYLNRNIESKYYEELISGNGRNTITIKNWPISVVLSMKIGNLSYEQIELSDFTSTGIKIKDRQLIAQGFKFEKGQDNILLTYMAGYKVIPNDISQACNELISHRALNERGDRQGVSSKSLAGETISFSHRSMPDSVKGSLKNYIDRLPIC